jgi:hypothetical protein
VSIEDRLEIRDINARYSHAYDGLDADEFSQLFVEDGVFEVFVIGKAAAVSPADSCPAARLPTLRDSYHSFLSQCVAEVRQHH